MSKRSIVPQGLEIYEFDQNVRILLRVACARQLSLDEKDLSLYDLLLCRFVLSLADVLDQSTGLSAQSIRNFLVLK